MALFLKLSGDLPAIEKSFFRNLVAAVMAFIMIIRSKEKIQIQKRNLHWFILRSLFGTLGIFCNFYAVDHLVLSDASCLNKYRHFCIVFSYLVLKEKITPTQCACVIAAFVGSLFIVKPSFAGGMTPAAVIGFAGGMCAGFAYTCVRKLGLRGEMRTNDRAFLLNIFYVGVCTIFDHGFSSDFSKAVILFVINRISCCRRTVWSHSGIYVCTSKGNFCI